MKKKIILGVMFIVMVTFLSSSAFAQAASKNLKGTVTITSLNFSDGKAQCNLSVQDFGKHIVATMKLYKGTSLLATWSGSDNSVLSLSGQKSVMSGDTLTLKFTATVDGVAISIPKITKIAP